MNSSPLGVTVIRVLVITGMFDRFAISLSSCSFAIKASNFCVVRGIAFLTLLASLSFLIFSKQSYMTVSP